MKDNEEIERLHKILFKIEKLVQKAFRDEK